MWLTFCLKDILSDRHFSPRQNAPRTFCSNFQRGHIAPNPKFWWTFCFNFANFSLAFLDALAYFGHFFTYLGHILAMSWAILNMAYGLGQEEEKETIVLVLVNFHFLHFHFLQCCNFENLCSLLFLPDEWKHESSASNKQYVASCLAFSY